MEPVQPKPAGKNLNIWRISLPKLQTVFKEIPFNIEAPIVSCRTFADRIVKTYNDRNRPNMGRHRSV